MSYIIDLFIYMILGIIQGITEIFPVSSSGHLVLFSKIFMGGKDLGESLSLFLMITNMGSFLALFMYYFKDIKSLIVDSWRFIFNRNSRNDNLIKENFNYSLKLIIAIIPIGIVGFFFNSVLNDYTNLLTVGISLILTALLLFLVFNLRNKNFENNISFKRASFIGLFQMFAVFPGISRSGITMVGGLSQKIEISKVLKFSFLSYIVVSVPVSALGLYDSIKNPGIIDIPGFVIAFVFSFIFSLLTVRIMSKYVKVNNLIWFSIYALLIGILSITLYFI
ncbi:undecaprenyl-diphosphate phosphatase [Acholeplasma granularum]|uniref:undecaprenyl-diphosphate phosphatase n=1 Tax=Acholeplasma granularum TaxID=264635 RepID=UPI00046E6DBC|nr:undecaprenyl-diphosphate phosphatase [Acholeplasma granularum]